MDAPAIPDGAPGYLGITSSLAMELASQLSPPSEVFARHGITPDDAAAIVADPTFQTMIKEAHAEWKSTGNVAERIKLKAQLALEELLIPTFQMAKDQRIPAPSRTDATKMFERLSGVAKTTEDTGGGGPKFVLSINVNADGPKEIVGEVIEQDE